MRVVENTMKEKELAREICAPYADHRRGGVTGDHPRAGAGDHL